jgi:pimeloyl-ACP methyl ester carboxylesterase
MAMIRTPSDCGDRLTLVDEGVGAFDVTVLPASAPSRVVLFAVGGGGNPERHRALLAALAASGCTVVAPHFERMLAHESSDSELLLRARRLRLALHAAAPPGLPVAGVGHSIGCALLLALAGGQMWTRDRRLLPIEARAALDRLVLLAPATGFFQAPGALDAVRTPILAWVGTQDHMTPPEQTLYLKEGLATRVPVDAHIVEGGGHFSFMDELPPGVTDPLPDRGAFLAGLATEVVSFVTTAQGPREAG